MAIPGRWVGDSPGVLFHPLTSGTEAEGPVTIFKAIGCHDGGKKEFWKTSHWK